MIKTFHAVQNGQDILEGIPRHPNDPLVAYGKNLDPDIVLPLIRDRVLMGAIFQGYCGPEELKAHVTPDLTQGFRNACGHFTGFFVTHEKFIDTNLSSGVAALRGLGNSSGFGIHDVPFDYEGNKTLEDFLPDNWLIKHVKLLGNQTKTAMGEYGYHILHAPAGRTEKGFAAFWHTHEDITSHLTLRGAGLQWMTSDVHTDDLKKSPEQYESKVQEVSIGDLMIMGRVAHRSSPKIPEQGQFAILTHGPFYNND